MASERGNNGLIWAGAAALAAVVLYKRVIIPRVIEPKRLMSYALKLRVYMPTARFKGDNVEFDLYIQNINNYPITVKGIVGDVWLTTQAKRYKLGNVARYGDVVIAPTKETKYSFAVRTRFLGLLPYFTDMVEGRIKNQTLSFEGNININGKVWPIKEGYKIS